MSSSVFSVFFINYVLFLFSLLLMDVIKSFSVVSVVNLIFLEAVRIFYNNFGLMEYLNLEN